MTPSTAAPITFPGNNHPTLGVEVEIWLIDPLSRQLAPRADDVLAHFASDPCFKPELFQALIEANTGVCGTVAEIEHDLRAKIIRLREITHQLGLGMISVGSHPLAHWREVPISTQPRYQNLLKNMRWAAHRCLIAGLHVHVGVKSGEHAVALMNALTVFIPHLLALSASSPFWHGHDTGMASSRIKTFEGMPTAGLPPYLINWNEFIALMRTLKTSGSISSIRDIWWDVRPHPGYGTVEVRICDAVNRLPEVCMLTAFIQTLVAHLSQLYDAGEALPNMRYWTLRENKWRAARDGLDAMFIRNEHGKQQPLRDSIEEWLARLEPVAASLHCQDYLRSAATTLRMGAGYQRRRDWAQQGVALVDHLADEFLTSSG